MSFVHRHFVLVAALVTGSVILEDSFVEKSSLVYHTSLACQKSVPKHWIAQERIGKDKEEHVGLNSCD